MLYTPKYSFIDIKDPGFHQLTLIANGLSEKSTG